jgi:conjugative relaxase-like TrwC/TraI family protein
MISMRILNPTSAAGQIAYLSETVAESENHSRAHAVGSDSMSALTRYFTDAGNPPGRWIGAGTAGLDLNSGWTVSASALERLFQDGTHPRTGGALTAHEYVKHVPLETRVAAEVAALPAHLTAAERAAAAAAIRSEQSEKRQRPSVSGFEMVFSPPKSFSVAWGLGDVALKERLTAAHDEALAQTIQVMESHYLRTRSGAAGVAQLATQGAVAARFDHWNSRALDPHLHTHVLIANRVQSTDGKWRTIDSRGALAPAVVTLSETYTSLLMDAVTRELGWDWNNTTPDAAAKNAKWELNGVPAELVTAFSQRSTALVEDKNRLVEQFVADRGRQPTSVEVLRLREMARRNTAPKKRVLSLQALTAEWQGRAAALLGERGEGWLKRLEHRAAASHDRRRKTLWRSDDLPADRVSELATNTLAALSGERSTWRRHNAAAEVQRLLKGERFASPADRQRAVDFIVDRVLERAIALTPPARFSAPLQFQTPDGISAFAPAASVVYTTQDVVDAEARLLAATVSASSPSVDDSLVDAVLAEHSQLDAGQSAAVAAIATAARDVDVLVGPAGTGKTTTLRVLREVWEAAHGAGSIVGLAPSAIAAEILGDSLGVATENTAKWLFEHERNPGEWSFRKGQLVIVDEAGLSGTLALDRLRSQAAATGAKLLLVGDPHQLTAIEAGGAFGMLVRELGGEAATLDSVWRFTNQWEATASLQLRHGALEALEAYDAHDRLHYGSRDEILADVFAAWSADESAGAESLLIADAGDTVLELNARAQQWRSDLGLVDLTVAAFVRGGAAAGVGDRVMTRTNDRHMLTSSGRFVKNGQRWIVAAAFADGSLVLSSPTDGDTLTVSAEYAMASVDLAYAVTTHRAQGSTVSTAHTVLTSAGTREAAYVGLTRGRLANHAWVITSDADSDDPSFTAPKTGREVLESVIGNSAAELSAHETRTRAERAAVTVQRLANEYDTLAAAASSARWSATLDTLLPRHRGSGFTDSTAWDSLVAVLRRHEAHGLPVESALPDLLASRPLHDGDDPAAVLHFRVEQWADGRRPLRQPERIAGLVARADITSADASLRLALAEREEAIIARTDALVAQAAADPQSWMRSLPRESVDEHIDALRTVAAYRDRHGVAENDPRPLGGPPASSTTARADWRAARTAWYSVKPGDAAADQRGAQPPSATPDSAPSVSGIRR